MPNIAAGFLAQMP